MRWNRLVPAGVVVLLGLASGSAAEPCAVPPTSPAVRSAVRSAALAATRVVAPAPATAIALQVDGGEGEARRHRRMVAGIVVLGVLVGAAGMFAVALGEALTQWYEE